MSDTTGKSAGERIFREVKTEEQAIAYVEGVVAAAERARIQLDETKLVARQYRAYEYLLVRYGRALGAITTLMHVRLLSDQAYNELTTRVHTALVPRVVDAMGVDDGA